MKVATITAGKKHKVFGFLYWKKREHHYLESKDRIKTVRAMTLTEACSKMIAYIKTLKYPDECVIDYEVCSETDYIDIRGVKIMEPYLF